jgi:spore cortex formation protein SpoVR/YcgB (stage V sporulation)
MIKRNIARTRLEQRVLDDLRIMAPRIDACGKRHGLNPAPANFTLKSDQQILDDIVYAGMPRHYKHWRYGKQAMQPRNGHVFEFALNSDPAEIALGSTNNLVMQILVMIHAWMGHVQMDQNALFKETEPHSIIQKFAQDERFVDWIIEKWGHEKYEWFMDAAQALEMHSGWLPSNRDMLPDSEHRRMLEASLKDLESTYRLAATDYDRQAVEDDIKDTMRLLQCHPIVPTDDFLKFLSDEENTPQLPWEAHKLIGIVREEHRYHQAFMRSRYMHEGWSHFWDTLMPWEPEIDMVGLGWANMLEATIADTMHDSYPIYWFHDVYAFGLHLWQYVDKTTSRKLGTETVHYTRLKLDDEGHVVDTGIEAQKVVDKWDRSYMYEVHRTFTDRRFFETFITDDSMAILNDKALEWVRRQMGQINKLLRDRGWDPALIFDPIPETLEDMYSAITVWYQQRQMSGMMRGWFGYGAPPFPIHEMVLEQMLQIVQTVAEWDTDKHAYKRQMIMYTDLSFMPNLRLIDSGRFSKAGMYTLRHEYDQDFGPLAQNDARETLRRFWRLGGPVQLLTWEILVDDFGRPWGPPRPYRYFTDNGDTVKERWL